MKFNQIEIPLNARDVCASHLVIFNGMNYSLDVVFEAQKIEMTEQVILGPCKMNLSLLVHLRTATSAAERSRFIRESKWITNFGFRTEVSLSRSVRVRMNEEVYLEGFEIGGYTFKVCTLLT